MDSRPYDIEPTRSGLPTLVLREGERKVYLHSRFAPEREAETLQDRFDPARYDLLIVLGTGLGYHLLPLKELIGRYRRIVLVDKLPGIREALREGPARFLAEEGRVIILSGLTPVEMEDSLSEIVRLEEISGIQVLEHPPSLRLFGEYYSSLKKSLERLITAKAGNAATRRAFAVLYLRNALKNLKRLQHYFPVRRLERALSGFPALVITSGPSLEDQLEELHEAAERCILIAVDSALPVLARVGLTPDFYVSIDPQAYIHEHLNRGGTGPAMRITSLTAAAELRDGRPAFLSLNSHPLSQLVEELYPGRVGSVDSHTGTVAGDALQTAFLLGAGPVGLLGLDFGFSGFSVYARGSAYQERWGLIFQDRFSPVETRNLRYILQASRGLKVEGRFTRKSFQQYRSSFEDLLAGAQGREIVNLSRRGLPLRGAPFREMGYFLERAKGPGGKSERVRELRSKLRPLKEELDLKALGDMLKQERVLEEILSVSGLEGVQERRIDLLRRFFRTVKLS